MGKSNRNVVTQPSVGLGSHVWDVGYTSLNSLQLFSIKWIITSFCELVFSISWCAHLVIYLCLIVVLDTFNWYIFIHYSNVFKKIDNYTMRSLNTPPISNLIKHLLYTEEWLKMFTFCVCKLIVRIQFYTLVWFLKPNF